MTLVEVLVALAVLGLVASAFSTSLVSSARYNANAGRRGEAVQLLNYLGRRLVAGDTKVLPPDSNPRSWAYGALNDSGNFPDLSREGSFADPEVYRATVRSVGTVSFAGASAAQYRLEVCWRASGAENCARADTIGQSPAALAGLN